MQAKGLKAVEQIYIEADEDHIHLNNGKSAEVKLVYVHEGRQRVHRGRTALMGVHYFVSVSNGNEIWDCVTDYLYAQYDTRNAEIHLSGDGANWIKQGLIAIPKAQYHLDKFHVYKSVTDATAGDRRLRNQIINSIKLGDSKSVQSLYMQRWGGIGTARARNRLYDSLQYIENNFDSIDLTAESNCSAEGHVSHVLSARLSSRPMAWSLAGAEKMAQLRAFYFNGGEFSELCQGRVKSEQEVLNAYNVHAIRADYNVDHSIPSGRIVGLNAVYDDVGRFLRYIVKK